MRKKNLLNIRGYRFDGWCNKLTGLRNYLDANLALLDPEVRRSLFPKERPIYTRVRDEVSAQYGENAKVSKTLVTDGCHIDGEVENSILFRGAIIEKGGNVELLKNAALEEGMVSLKEAGMRKVRDGITSLEAAFEVTGGE